MRRDCWLRRRTFLILVTVACLVLAGPANAQDGGTDAAPADVGGVDAELPAADAGDGPGGVCGRPEEQACEGLELDEACSLGKAGPGTCQVSKCEDGRLICQLDCDFIREDDPHGPPCEGKAENDRCVNDDGADGTCISTQDARHCKPRLVCFTDRNTDGGAMDMAVSAEDAAAPDASTGDDARPGGLNPPASTDEGGCSAAGAGGAPGVGLLLLAALVALRRRTPR